MAIPEPVVCLLQACVDPADDVAAAHVPDEQEQAVGALAQPSVAQGLPWQRARFEQGRFRTCARTLAIAAAVEVPIALQPRAGRITSNRQRTGDLGPADGCVARDEGFRSGIGNALMLHGAQQPVADRRGIPL